MALITLLEPFFPNSMVLPLILFFNKLSISLTPKHYCILFPSYLRFLGTNCPLSNLLIPSKNPILLSVQTCIKFANKKFKMAALGWNQTPQPQ